MLWPHCKGLQARPDGARPKPPTHTSSSGTSITFWLWRAAARAGVSQRSCHRAALGQHRRIRPLLHRRDDDLSPGPGISDAAARSRRNAGPLPASAGSVPDCSRPSAQRCCWWRRVLPSPRSSPPLSTACWWRARRDWGRPLVCRHARGVRSALGASERSSSGSSGGSSFASRGGRGPLCLAPSPVARGLLCAARFAGEVASRIR